MSLKEIIGILETEKNKLQKENIELKKSNYEYAKEIRNLKWEIKKLTVKLKSLKKTSNEVADKPVVEEVESQLTAVVANVDGETYADIVEGDTVSIDDVIEEQKPKVLFADAVSAIKTSILIGDLAKLIRQNGVEVGQKRLFEWLRNNGWLMKSGNSKNMPTQRGMEMKLFEVKEGSYVDSNGVNVVTKTTKVTGKGQQYFVNIFLKGRM